MSFSVNFSFSLSFSLGGDASYERHLIASDTGGNSPLPSLPRHNIQPSSVVDLPVPTNTPTKPVLRKVTRYVRKKSTSAGKGTLENKETHISNTLESKASDRESLQILLDASKQQVVPTIITTPPSVGTAVKSSNSSLVQHSSSLFVSIPSEDPFVSSPSPIHDDDSGSDLVSSLQRLRVGGLSSYLREMGRHADLTPSSSTGAIVSMERKADAAEQEEANQTHDTHDSDSDEWEVVANEQCWKKHRHIR